MPLFDSMSSKSEQSHRFSKMSTIPTTDDLRYILEETKKRKKPVDLPFEHPHNHQCFIIRVQMGQGQMAQPIWTFLFGEGAQARVKWSRPATEVLMIQSKISMESGQTQEAQTQQSYGHDAAQAQPQPGLHPLDNLQWYDEEPVEEYQDPGADAQAQAGNPFGGAAGAANPFANAANWSQQSGSAPNPFAGAASPPSPFGAPPNPMAGQLAPEPGPFDGPDWGGAVQTPMHLAKAITDPPPPPGASSMPAQPVQDQDRDQYRDQYQYGEAAQAAAAGMSGGGPAMIDDAEFESSLAAAPPPPAPFPAPVPPPAPAVAPYQQAQAVPLPGQGTAAEPAKPGGVQSLSDLWSTGDEMPPAAVPPPMMQQPATSATPLLGVPAPVVAPVNVASAAVDVAAAAAAAVATPPASPAPATGGDPPYGAPASFTVGSAPGQPANFTVGAAPKKLPDPFPLDWTVSQQARAQLKDPTTGFMQVPGFVFFMQLASELFKKSNIPCAVIILEIAIRYPDGHVMPLPPEALLPLSDRLQSCCSPVDFMAHLSAGEFIVVLNVAEGEDAVDFCRKLHGALTASPLLPDATGKDLATIAIGAASLPETSPDPEVVIAAAFEARNTAKQSALPYLLFSL